jgi:hypothetical protein
MEMLQIPISLVFDLTQPELKPAIYRTCGDHANHYTTNTIHHN